MSGKGKQIADVKVEDEDAAGGLVGMYRRITNSPGLAKVTRTGKMFVDGTWKATSKLGEYAWVVGATAVVVVLPLLLEMEREATFQLQADLVQRQVMDIQRGAGAGTGAGAGAGAP